MFFRKHIEDDTNKIYQLFLDKIDPLSQTMIRGYDMSFNNLRDKLKIEGLELTELDCIGKNVLIKRNITGYYLVNKTDVGIKVFKKYEDDFRRMHLYLLDKERIIDGEYICKKRDDKYLKDVVQLLGYGKNRDKVLRENWTYFMSIHWKN